MSSVTLVHPVKAVKRNEMPFGRHTHVITSNILLDRGLDLLMGLGDLWVGTPAVRSDAAYCQITSTIVYFSKWR